MKQVLLHCCCAPCSASIIEWMLNNGYMPTLYFYNPNIYPTEEYLKRKEELIRYAKKINLPYIDGDYDHQHWLDSVVGLEDQPERGLRCNVCFFMRLKATALIAAEHNFPIFTTTLTSSRWKNYEQIVDAGNRAAAFLNKAFFWDQDWKKGGLTERRKILLEVNGFYNQQYCGCEYSIRK